MRGEKKKKSLMKNVLLQLLGEEQWQGSHETSGKTDIVQ